MQTDSILPKNWREILAKNILGERLRLKYSQKKLLDRLNDLDIPLTNVGTISVWENGKGRFNLDIIDALCRIFNRLPNEMMYEDLSQKPPEPPPRNGKRYALNTEGVGEPAAKEEEELIIEMDVGGAISANESPPIKKEDIKKMRQDLLKMMQKLETIDSE